MSSEKAKAINIRSCFLCGQLLVDSQAVDYEIKYRMPCSITDYYKEFSTRCHSYCVEAVVQHPDLLNPKDLDNCKFSLQRRLWVGWEDFYTWFDTTIGGIHVSTVFIPLVKKGYTFADSYVLQHNLPISSSREASCHMCGNIIVQNNMRNIFSMTTSTSMGYLPNDCKTNMATIAHQACMLKWNQYLMAGDYSNFFVGPEYNDVLFQEFFLDWLEELLEMPIVGDFEDFYKQIYKGKNNDG